MPGAGPQPGGVRSGRRPADPFAPAPRFVTVRFGVPAMSSRIPAHAPAGPWTQGADARASSPETEGGRVGAHARWPRRPQRRMPRTRPLAQRRRAVPPPCRSRQRNAPPNQHRNRHAVRAPRTRRAFSRMRVSAPPGSPCGEGRVRLAIRRRRRRTGREARRDHDPDYKGCPRGRRQRPPPSRGRARARSPPPRSSRRGAAARSCAPARGRGFRGARSGCRAFPVGSPHRSPLPRGLAPAPEMPAGGVAHRYRQPAPLLHP